MIRGFVRSGIIESKVLKYVLLGVAIDEGIHDLVPEGCMALIVDDEAWWSVPLSVIIGISMYTFAAGIFHCRGSVRQEGLRLEQCWLS